MPYKDPVIRSKKATERAKKWAQENPEKANAKGRQWRSQNIKWFLHHGAKRRAKRDGVLFNLELTDIPDIPEICPIALIPVHPRNDGNQGPCDNSPSLDRINPVKGYVPGNVRVISHKGNRWKSDMVLNDLERLLKYMKGI